jgi:hypothetical protein
MGRRGFRFRAYPRLLGPNNTAEQLQAMSLGKRRRAWERLTSYRIDYTALFRHSPTSGNASDNRHPFHFFSMSILVFVEPEVCRFAWLSGWFSLCRRRSRVDRR